VYTISCKGTFSTGFTRPLHGHDCKLRYNFVSAEQLRGVEPDELPAKGSSPSAI